MVTLFYALVYKNFIVFVVGIKFFFPLFRIMNETKQSSCRNYWRETDNLNVSSYLRDAKAIIEPRLRLHNILIFVRSIIFNYCVMMMNIVQLQIGKFRKATGMF